MENGRKAPQSHPVPFAEASTWLRKAGLAFCETAFVENEAGAVSAATKLGFPVFLKVVSLPTGGAAIHKSKQGLVARAESREACISVFRKIAAAHANLAAKKAVERKLLIAVQKEASGTECIIGLKIDSSFGGIILFGSGGVFAEDISDTAIRLAPVSEADAAAMIKETKLHKKLMLLKDPDAALKSLATAISKVSKLAESHPEISELDINPLMVDASGNSVAVDARAVTFHEKKKNGKAAAKGKKPAADWKSLAVSNFFNPFSIAVIGASRGNDSVGQAIMRNLTIGCVHRCEYCRPFLGKIFPVNPNAPEILGLKSYPSILAIPEQVDLAIIAIPHQMVLKAVDESVRKKVKAVIIISAGFGEFNDEGKKIQLKIVEKLEKVKIPMLGPNCLGVIRPGKNLNASFAPSMPPAGSVAFVSQSGALADSIVDWAIQSRYGLSAMISYGNKAILDCHHFFDYLAADEATKSVALYIEGVGNGREFFEKLRKLSEKKPVVVLKGGRTGSGNSAAATHTASLAADVKVFGAAVKQAGAFLADTVEELFDLAKVLGEQPPCQGNGIAVVTNGGGCGVICSDYCEELGVELPQPSRDALKTFDKSGIMHPAYSRRNPLDIVGDAMPDRYELAINTILKEPGIHGMIVIQTLQAMTNPILNAKAIVEAHKLFPQKPILSCFMGGRFSRKGMHYLENMHIPDFNDVRKAVVAMKALIDRGEFVKGLETAKGMAKKGK